MAPLSQFGVHRIMLIILITCQTIVWGLYTILILPSVTFRIIVNDSMKNFRRVHPSRVGPHQFGNQKIDTSTILGFAFPCSTCTLLFIRHSPHPTQILDPSSPTLFSFCIYLLRGLKSLYCGPTGRAVPGSINLPLLLC